MKRTYVRFLYHKNYCRKRDVWNDRPKTLAEAMKRAFPGRRQLEMVRAQEQQQPGQAMSWPRLFR